MADSSQWRACFETNAETLLEIPWHLGAELTQEEAAAIGRSLREFQAGESSEGLHLYRYAKDYAERHGDSDYLAAMRLFIAEEQRHGRDLGRFLELNGIELVLTTFTDRVFRRLRNLFGGLEVSVAVLVTAEVIAKVYYAALREATESQILRRLCDQIHVEFQTNQLHKLRVGRGRVGVMCSMALQRFLFLGTVLVVWPFHRRALRRGGYRFGRYWRACWEEFRHAFRSGPPPAPPIAAAKACAADLEHTSVAATPITTEPAGRGDTSRSENDPPGRRAS